ncbi:3-hydroxyadipyl-CoA dehydrogenase [bacterium HR40]|nr:3-hydroxyadipyl-CoA dehydrogenase [bacterium HR40]
MFDPGRSDLTLGIVGTGTMGRGIAQVAAEAGCQVLLCDARAEAVAAARDELARIWQRLAERGRLDRGRAGALPGRLAEARGLGELAPCDLVIEAIVEDLEAKRQLFRDLEAVVRDECVLATNTSSLSVTAIAAVCRRPERVAGFHFFNPVPLMRVVEVIDGLLTAPSVGEALAGLARRFGHRPVRVRDMPGFLVNHAGRGYTTEALRILSEGVADEAEIDRVLREAAGFRMGPFELLDLTGLDVSVPVMEQIYHQFYEEPRFRPVPILRRRLEAGLLGRKSGRGFYRYREGRAEVRAPEPPPQLRPAKVWVAPLAHATRVRELVRRLGAEVVEGRAPEDGLLVVAPVGDDATTTARAFSLDARRVVAIDPLCGLDSHRTLMTTPATDPEIAAQARGLFAADGVPVTCVHDSPGFICQRVLATIVNIACEIAQQRIAAPADIDEAVGLGLGYPKGPLAWGDELGAETVMAILQALQRITGDPRYRPSLWLRRRAMLRLSLLAAEG